MARNNAPKYRHHKVRNLAKVTLNRRDIYLGEYESPESYRRYAEIIAAWRRADDVQTIIDRCMNGNGEDHQTESKSTGTWITVGELSLRYWEFAFNYYASHDGKQNGRTAVAKSALAAANKLCADIKVNEFGPLKLLKIRQALIDRKVTRRYVNDCIYIINSALQPARGQRSA